MSSFEDEAMDFGDDDDGEFLTGKLAALGIDEDLELSGGEEENQDPAPLSKHVTAEPPPPAPPSPSQTRVATATRAGRLEPKAQASSAGKVDAWDSDWKQTPAAPATAAAAAVEKQEEQWLPSAAGGAPIEEGELLDMLQKPLQTSRHNPEGSRQDRTGGSGGGARKSGGRGNRKRKSNNGKAHGRNVTISECARWVCERLNEPKYYLMCQVVASIGYNTSKRLLDQVRQTQEAGGMATADGTRKRTPGGVFFTLLKDHVDPAKLKALYADEVRVKKEKDRAQRAAKKRKAAAADAGEDVMPPRNPPRSGFTARRDMGRWVGPGGVTDAKRARGRQTFDG